MKESVRLPAGTKPPTTRGTVAQDPVNRGGVGNGTPPRPSRQAARRKGGRRRGRSCGDLTIDLRAAPSEVGAGAQCTF